MNKDNAKQFLPLVQALSEGKTLQRKATAHSTWEDVDECCFTFNPECYRIKPEPKRIWVNEYSVNHSVHDTKEQAEMLANTDYAKRIAVEYVEVLP